MDVGDRWGGAAKDPGGLAVLPPYPHGKQKNGFGMEIAQTSKKLGHL